MTFLYALVHPSILNPFQVEPHTAWAINCYAFGVPIVIINMLARGGRWRPTMFDYCLLAYIALALATWPTSFNRQSTWNSIVGLGAQVAVFGAVRLLAVNQPAIARIVVAGLVAGIGMLEWTAFDTHLRIGLEARVLVFPPLEWSGREGLGLAAAIQCGLLVGVWQRTRSRMVQLASLALIVVAVVECLFMYSRVPWAALAAALVAACLVGLRVGGFRRTLLAVAAIGAFVAVVGTPYMLHLARMAAGLAQGPESGLSFRMAAWLDAPKVIARYPIRGTGLGTYMAVRPTIDMPRSPYLPPDLPSPLHPHNAYLQQLAEVGIVGGVAFAMMWGTALWAGWRVSTDRAVADGLNLGLFLALVALVVSNLGENMFDGTERLRFQSMAWIAAGVIIAEWTRVRQVNHPGTGDAVGERRLRFVLLAAAVVVGAYQIWAGFFHETPAVSIEGYHRKSADEFGRGAVISQAFHMEASGFTSADVQFSTDRPLNLLLRCDLTPIDEPNAPRTAPPLTQFVTIKRVSGVEWRRLSFPGEETSGLRWYLLRLELVGVSPADEAGQQPVKPSADAVDRVGVIVSIDNVYGGGAMWIDDRRQIGSLSLRAFSRWRTAFERFRIDVAPKLPRALQSAVVDIALVAAYQMALLTVLYALLVGDAGRDMRR